MILFFNQTENTRIMELRSVIDPHIDAEFAKFVIGTRPLSQLNAYFDELDRLGIRELLGLYEKAYASYRENLGK